MENSPKDILEKYYQKVLHFLSFRPRSEKEIFIYLKKKLKDTNNIEQIIIHLKNENLINDGEFVDWWLEQRLNFNPKSKKVLRLELRQKGICQDLIEEKLATIDSTGEKKAINKIIEKKMRLYTTLSKFELRNKLLRYLVNYGFNYDIAKNSVDEFMEKR